jgi:hypothetical protein
MTPDRPYDQILSIGYRCSSAGILKSLGYKHESFPFDWLVSRLPIIEHCIESQFKELLNPDNYKCDTGVTNNYTSMESSSRQWICNESICVNEYYETTPTIKYYLPQPISPERDAYGYRLMMNHRNIKTNPQDQEYFARCVERWKCISSKRILALYIHPVTFYEEFLSIKSELIGELRRAHKSISTTHPHDGIYIIPVKTPYTDPTNHCCKYVLEEQPDDPTTPRCRICILWANRDFIDAGEIFMGTSHTETYVIKDYLQNTVTNKGLLQNATIIS